MLKPRSREAYTNQSSAIIPSGTTGQSSRLPQPAKPSSRTSPLKFFASSSSLRSGEPKEAHKAWQAEFLSDLRSNRPVRPSGSRPPPNRQAVPGSISLPDPPLRTSSAMSGSVDQMDIAHSQVPDRCSSAMSHVRAQPELPTRDEVVNSRGRALVQGPQLSAAIRDFSAASKTSMITPSSTYREGGQRWIEKQEARSLREALEDMDLQAEVRLHAAAQDEASELVWRHRNPSLANRNSYAPYNYKSHLEKGSHARSQSNGQYPSIDLPSETEQPQKEPTSDISEQTNSYQAFVEYGKEGTNGVQPGEGEAKGHALWDSPEKRAYINLSHPIPPLNISGRRRSGSFRSRKASGGLFRNPNDQIYEEPDEMGNEPDATAKLVPGTLQAKDRNPVPKLEAGTKPFIRSETAPIEGSRKHSRFEIHKNPPSQSRNPSYVKNALSPTLTDSADANDKEARSSHPFEKGGKEIRGDDIRAATTMRIKDRSPKLPSPTVVSDRRGRPIVSFDQDWKPKEGSLKHETSSVSNPSGLGEIGRISPLRPLKPHHPISTASAPSIPTINLPEPPSIQINSDTFDSSIDVSPPKPLISSETPYMTLQEAPRTNRSLPTPNSKPGFKPHNRPFPRKSSTTPSNASSPHWSPSPRFHRATAQCYACALPISGRIVSAASQRFHPQCFTCHHCSALLEHVAFYPEPEVSRIARLARIEARANGNDLLSNETEMTTAEHDGDDGLRFYCHLDFHESFSPRCRSCKTPIEGEVVVACGGEWHVGHFFCAECGDPFDAKTPFVEREGYAWCVGCHTKRFSGKCKGCRKPIVDVVVRALGEEWHEGCFCCKVCDLQFQ